MITFPQIQSENKQRKNDSDDQKRINAERLQGALAMAGGVCHELTQPLQIAAGSSELLLMGLSENDPLYKTINRIKEQIDRMGELTRKLSGIRRYKTKEFIQGTVFDIDSASV